jgi:hypothetical protein
MKLNNLKVFFAIYLYKGFCKRQICHCHCEISGYYSNELQSVNTLHEIMLNSKSRMSEQCVLFVGGGVRPPRSIIE